MKTCISTILFLLINHFAFSQVNHPPKSVRESFQKTYPLSQPSHWDRTSGGWSVDFEDKDHDNGEATAHFSSTGRNIDTQVPYDNKDVPAPVVDNLHQKYNGSDNYAFTRIDRPGEKAVYQAQFTHQSKHKTLYVDEKGNTKDNPNRH